MIQVLSEPERQRSRRTTLDCIGLRVISDVRGFWFSDLHQAIFLYLCQSQVFFVPLQSASDGNHQFQDRFWSLKVLILTVADSLTLARS